MMKAGGNGASTDWIYSQAGSKGRQAGKAIRAATEDVPISVKGLLPSDDLSWKMLSEALTEVCLYRLQS